MTANIDNNHDNPLISIDNDLFLDEKLEIPYDINFNPDINYNINGINDHFDPENNFNSTPYYNSQYFTIDKFNDDIVSLDLSGNELSIFYVNIRSVRHKFDMFLDYLNSLNHKFSIIALTETWLKNEETSMYNIPGYSAEHQNRDSKNGGGICLFIDENLKYVRKDNLSINDSTSLESLFIEIINEKTRNFVVGAVYRPPNNKYVDFELALNRILSQLDRRNKPCYILGDFNIDLLKYNQCNLSNQFFNLLSSSSY